MQAWNKLSQWEKTEHMEYLLFAARIKTSGTWGYHDDILNDTADDKVGIIKTLCVQFS